MTAPDLISALRRVESVLAEAVAALERADAEIAAWREAASRAMAERDELRIALAMGVKRARAVA